jgi:putative thiamine transport system permease protein
VPAIAWLVSAVLALPVLAGLVGTVLPAFGHMPALGARGLDLGPMRDLAAWPGIWASVTLSLQVGLLSTAISAAAVILICASLHRSWLFQAALGQLSVLLSVPHAAAAFGLAFLIAPSGWIARAISPWLSGWDRPPDLLIVNDPEGLALVAGLVIKEIPFLLLMTLAALGQVRTAQADATARALGYRPTVAWLKTVLPEVYRQIRLPVYAVLAFSVSVVDMAIILAPNTPPPLAVQVVLWMNDPDLTLRLQAAAGATLQLGLVIAALLIWRALETVVGWAGRRWTAAGGRGADWAERAMKAAATLLLVLSGCAILFGLAGLAIWSLAGLWPFPDVIPDQMTLRSWARVGPRLGEPVVETLLIGLAALALALALTVASLEVEHRMQLRPGSGALWLLYLPLLVPQVSFLSGLQTLSLGAGLDGGRGAVILAHLVFVLPYVFLTLSGPWRAWDPRFGTVALALGASPARVLWRVRLPMLLAPVLTASAVGLSVSVGQYLPTLLIGGGRVETLTTEAIALASGGDRRIIGIYALTQTAVALAPFALAIFIPRLMARRLRRAAHA